MICTHVISRTIPLKPPFLSVHQNLSRQVFKVTDAMDDPLTQRRYYQYSHHPEFIQKKAKS